MPTELPNLTIVDGLIGIVVLLSVLRGFAHGAVREVVRLACWVGTFVVAFVFAPSIRPYMPEIGLFGDFANACLIRGFLAFAALFLLTLAVLSVLAPVASRAGKTHYGTIDSVLGGLFGLLRGLVVILGAFLLYDVLVPDTEKSDLLTSATSFNILGSWAEMVRQSAAANLPGWLGGRIEALVEGCEGFLEAIPELG